MPQIDNLDFLNLNTLRNYPIKEGMSRTDVDGVFTIPNDFIADLQIAASYDPTRGYYISKIANFEDSIVVEISDNSSVLVGSFTVLASGFSEYAKFFLTATDDYVGATGVICIGWLTNITSQPTGNFTFTLAHTELEARASIPALKGINRLIFKNASGKTFAATGDVEIYAQTNLRFSSPAANHIVIDAGENLGLNTDCSSLLPCIKTINGVPPDEEGNFTLDFSDCAELTPIPANTGLLLADQCCKPCTGCNDIEELTNRLTATESQLISLKDYYQSLSLLFENFKTTVTYTCNCPPE